MAALNALLETLQAFAYKKTVTSLTRFPYTILGSIMYVYICRYFMIKGFNTEGPQDKRGPRIPRKLHQPLGTQKT